MSGRPWIEWLGGPCPIAKGTVVDLREASPDRNVQRERLSFEALSDADGSGPSWRWVRGYWHVIAYRLSDTDDKAKREARMESFRKMAQPNEFDVRPVKAPHKLGVGK